MIIGKNRHSRVVEGSVVKTERIGTTERRKKRTVYHTPAIIETVIEEPDIEIPKRVVQVRQDVARRGSVVIAPRPVTVHPARNTIATVRKQNISRFTPQAPIKNVQNSRNFGVKVTEDLAEIQPILQDQYGKGCCESNYLSTVNCFRLFKCPFWLCCIIPLILLLALLVGGYCLNKSHIINQKRNIFQSQITSNTFKSQSNIFPKQNQQKNKIQIVAPIVQQPIRRQSKLQSSLSQNNKIYPVGNKNKVVTKIVEVEDKTQIIEKDQYQLNTQRKTQQAVQQRQNKQEENKVTQSTQNQNKQEQNKQAQKQEQSKNNNNTNSKQQQKQQNTSNSSDQNNKQNLNINQTSNTITTTTETNNTSAEKPLPSTKSLISSLFSFNIAPTFKQYWNTASKTHHLRYFI